jgi:mRNA-degrading endonuclease toxin of MazEF toxin-antitoxin module
LTVARGEVWLYEHPDRKRRPALILSRDDLIEENLDVIAVPTTGTIRGTPTEIQIGVADGMPAECVLVLANTFSAEKAYLTKHITTLDSVRMHEVCRALSAATDC